MCVSSFLPANSHSYHDTVYGIFVMVRCLHLVLGAFVIWAFVIESQAVVRVIAPTSSSKPSSAPSPSKAPSKAPFPSKLPSKASALSKSPTKAPSVITNPCLASPLRTGDTIQPQCASFCKPTDCSLWCKCQACTPCLPPPPLPPRPPPPPPPPPPSPSPPAVSCESTIAADSAVEECAAWCSQTPKLYEQQCVMKTTRMPEFVGRLVPPGSALHRALRTCFARSEKAIHVPSRVALSQLCHVQVPSMPVVPAQASSRGHV